MKDEKIPTSLRNALLLSLGLGILVFMLYRVGVSGVLTTIGQVHVSLLILAGSIIFAATLMRMTRWLLIYRALPLGSAAKIYFISKALNEVAPAGSGELTRAYLAKDRFSVPVGKTLAPVVLERVADTTILLVGSITFLIFFLPSSSYWSASQFSIWISVGIAATLLALSIYFLIRIRRLEALEVRLQSVFSGGPAILNSITNKLSHATGSFRRAMEEVKDRKVIFLKISIPSIIIWSLEAVGQHFLFASFGVSIPIFFLWTVICLSWIVGTFSFVPGGLGFREAAYVISVGTSQGVALSAILLYRLIANTILGIASATGAISLTKQ